MIHLDLALNYSQAIGHKFQFIPYFDILPSKRDPLFYMYHSQPSKSRITKQRPGSLILPTFLLFLVLAFV